MTRYFRIFLLQFQHVFEQRGNSFIWFLISITNPILLILYWYSALKGGKQIAGWDISTISTYYFFLTITAATLMSHIEIYVSYDDILKGNLVKYLTKPYSYFWKKFTEEIPYRFLQGFFGICICIFAAFVFNIKFSIPTDIILVPFIILILISAYLLSFIFKMILGFTAFWLTDAKGFYNFTEICILIFAGYILPLNLMPEKLMLIAKFLPFSYIIYYPILSMQGILSLEDIFKVLAFQWLWIAFFYFLYKFVWIRGVRKFTGMGD